jgi:hypothetical protein
MAEAHAAGAQHASDAATLISEFDEDGDGKLDAGELARLVHHIQHKGGRAVEVVVLGEAHLDLNVFSEGLAPLAQGQGQGQGGGGLAVRAGAVERLDFQLGGKVGAANPPTRARPWVVVVVRGEGRAGSDPLGARRRRI